MTNPPPARLLRESRTSLTLIVLHPQLNPHTGFCDEGQLLHLADDAAYIAAMRHALCRRASTGAVSSFKFTDQARINDLVVCHAHVAATGNRSMLVEISLEVFSPPYVESRPLATGDFLYVLMEADYSPLKVPPLEEARKEPHHTTVPGKIPDARERLAAIKTRQAP